MAAAEVIEVLKEIEACAFRNAAPLPLKRDNQPEWTGLGFQVGGMRLVTPIGHVVEVMKVPRLTRLPGTREWVLGVANVRGRLLTVMDTHRYLGVTSTLPRTAWRVLVVEDGDLAVGLLVEQSLGLQYFLEESFEEDVPETVGVLGTHVRGAYRNAGRVYYVTDLQTLVRDDEFFDVAQR